MTTARPFRSRRTAWTHAGSVLVALLVGPSLACAQRQETPEAPYFGQASPGRTPRLFAPERFRDPGECHGPPVFSPDLMEAYWTPRPGHGRNTALMSRRVGGVWSEQRYEAFGLQAGATEVTLSPDGTRIFFLSRQPLPGERLAPDDPQLPERIWWAPRAATGIGHLRGRLRWDDLGGAAPPPPQRQQRHRRDVPLRRA